MYILRNTHTHTHTQVNQNRSLTGREQRHPTFRQRHNPGTQLRQAAQCPRLLVPRGLDNQLAKQHSDMLVHLQQGPSQQVHERQVQRRGPEHCGDFVKRATDEEQLVDELHVGLHALETLSYGEGEEEEKGEGGRVCVCVCV